MLILGQVMGPVPIYNHITFGDNSAIGWPISTKFCIEQGNEALKIAFVGGFLGTVFGHFGWNKNKINSKN